MTTTTTPDQLVAALLDKLDEFTAPTEAAYEVAQDPEKPPADRAAAWRVVADFLGQAQTIAREAADVLDPRQAPVLDPAPAGSAAGNLDRYWSEGCGADVLAKTAELVAADRAAEQAG